MKKGKIAYLKSGLGLLADVVVYVVHIHIPHTNKRRHERLEAFWRFCSNQFHH